MSTIIISEEKGYGFSLIRFHGGERGRCYQLNVGDKYIVLTAWQMVQLFSHIGLLAHKGEAI